MSKPAFIVDGHQEQRIVQQLCPGAPVKRLDCNGKDVEIAAAVKRIASLIRLMGGKYYPVIIVYDRESRAQSSEEIKKAIIQELQTEGIKDPIIVGVPDRTIENWILADWHNARTKGHLSNPLRQPVFEGLHGKSEIKKLLPQGTQYHETIEGVEWFVSSKPLIMATASKSFYDFMASLSAIPCAWLQGDTDTGQTRLPF